MHYALRILCTILGVVVLALANTSMASAQDYPAKSIKFVVPYPPGGASDVTARILGQKLAEAYGQTVVIENRPGANGNIALEAVAKAAPDGYTILMGNVGPNAINSSLYKSLPFNPIKSFSPIILISTVPIVLLVNPALPVKDLKQLIAYVKSNHGKTTFASGGNGSATHLTGEMLNTMAGLDTLHVPYKGDAAAMAGLVGGEVTMTFVTSIAAMPQIKGGRVKVIAVAGKKRVVSLPDVPTIAESGLPGFDANSWGGILAPAGTPEAVTASLHEQFAKILAAPDVKDKIHALGAEIVSSSSAEFAEHIKTEINKWSAVVKACGATLD